MYQPAGQLLVVYL